MNAGIWQGDQASRLSLMTGVGGGVSDRLRELGAKVVAVNFGSSPTDKTNSPA